MVNVAAYFIVHDVGGNTTYTVAANIGEAGLFSPWWRLVPSMEEGSPSHDIFEAKDHSAMLIR